MTEQMFRITMTGDGEVRDAAGNLKSSTPGIGHIDVPESHLREIGLTDEQINDIKEQQA